ncbi:TonB-dependent receptor [Sphingomonas sp. HMWF008]|nr:TonB-dependent receptor [Sphingomonas sp. HMWF008]
MIRPYRQALLLGTALTVLGLSHAAQAQDNSAPVTAAPVGDGDIVVTGVRASNQKAVRIKRASDQIIDTVSASEIGQLPDFNAGDALKRLPGVNALLYQGEPRFIIIRGFNQTYNDILIDGFSLASTDVNLGQTNSGGRQVSLEVLPANLASHIDVIKSAIPSTEANYIGGLANFATASAFDFNKDTLTASVKAGQAFDSKGKGGDHFAGQAEIAGAKRFGSGDQFGLYLSATYWSRQINVAQVETGGTRNWYTATGALTTPYGGNGYAVPSQRLYYNYQNKRERLGFQGRFDWKPSDSFSAYVSAYHFHQREDSDRNDLNAAVQASSRVTGQTATSGTLTNVTQTMQLGRYRWSRNLSGLYSRFEGTLGGGLKLDGGASWSTSRVDNPQTVDAFAQTNMQFNYDTSGAVPLFTAINPTAAGNLALYPTNLHREERYRLGEDRYDAQLNLTYNTAPGDRGFGAAIGGRYSAIRQDVSFSRTNYTRLTYTLADASAGATLCGFVCDTPIPVVNAEKVDALFAAQKAGALATIDTAAVAGGTFSTREDVTAGYIQAQYRTDRLYLVGGVRVEHTKSGSSSTQATNGVYAPVSASTDYTNVLPSGLLVFDTTDASKLRIGASMTVSRPNFGASSLRGGVLNTLSNPPTLSTGNPDLKPRRAVNADIGHDWYLDGGRGIVSIAGFYKWIRDDIFTYGVLQSVPGVTGQVLVTQARNTGQLVRAYGIEVSASHDLTFLPAPFDGLGVSANATFSRAHFPVTLSDGSTRVLNNLPSQPGRIYNASLYYDKGRVHGRVAWNYLGKLYDDRFPNFTPAGFYANRYQQATNNVDVQLSYDVTHNVTVSLDALNLSKQGMRYKYGVDQELLQSAWSLPTQVLAGVKVKL